MDITVSSRARAVSDDLRQYAEAKIGRLEKYLGGMDRADVHFSEERNPRIPARERCEVTVYGQGYIVRARGAAFEQFATVDLVVEKLEQQLHKLKTRLTNRNNGKGARPRDIMRTVGEATDEVDGQVEVGPIPKVVKLKQFEMPAMSVDDAITRLEMVDHGFYVFLNAESGEMSVLYRRDDGDLGLIQRVD